MTSVKTRHCSTSNRLHPVTHALKSLDVDIRKSITCGIALSSSDGQLTKIERQTAND